MHVKFSFHLHSPPQINLSIAISVTTGLEFSHHTNKTWEMSKCIGHKYRKWNGDKRLNEMTSPVNGCSTGVKFARVFSSSRDPTFVFNRIWSLCRWAGSLVSRILSGLMRMRRILPIPSGVRMGAVTGVTSSLWTLGPRGTWRPLESHSWWTCRQIKNRQFAWN